MVDIIELGEKKKASGSWILGLVFNMICGVLYQGSFLPKSPCCFWLESKSDLSRYPPCYFDEQDRTWGWKVTWDLPLEGSPNVQLPFSFSHSSLYCVCIWMCQIRSTFCLTQIRDDQMHLPCEYIRPCTHVHNIHAWFLQFTHNVLLSKWIVHIVKFMLKVKW